MRVCAAALTHRDAARSRGARRWRTRGIGASSAKRPPMLASFIGAKTTGVVRSKRHMAVLEAGAGVVAVRVTEADRAVLGIRTAVEQIELVEPELHHLAVHRRRADVVDDVGAGDALRARPREAVGVLLHCVVTERISR